MATKTKVAAGLITFRRLSNELQYLLLQASNGEFHWSPPKGGVDAGETELQAALRETQEEAGLAEDQLKLHNDFKCVLEYEAWGRPKSVVYWLSEVKNPSVEIKISHEHKDWKWFNFTDAFDIVKFKDMQEALKQANDFINAKL